MLNPEAAKIAFQWNCGFWATIRHSLGMIRQAN